MNEHYPDIGRQVNDAFNEMQAAPANNSTPPAEHAPTTPEQERFTELRELALTALEGVLPRIETIFAQQEFLSRDVQGNPVQGDDYHGDIRQKLNNLYKERANLEKLVTPLFSDFRQFLREHPEQEQAHRKQIITRRIRLEDLKNKLYFVRFQIMPQLLPGDQVSAHEYEQLRPGNPQQEVELQKQLDTEISAAESDPDYRFDDLRRRFEYPDRITTATRKTKG